MALGHPSPLISHSQNVTVRPPGGIDEEEKEEESEPSSSQNR